MTTVHLTTLVNSVKSLPSLSVIVTGLLSSMDSEDVDVHAIAKQLSCDQALAAKTLRLANSSFYGMQHQVSNMNEAIVILGLRNVRTLITASLITRSFAGKKVEGFDFLVFWSHSIAVAVCARELANDSRFNPDTAFIAGLLHDLGRLVLVTGHTELYRTILAYKVLHQCEDIEAETAILGTDHCVIGQALAAHWKFPEEMQLAVLQHHPKDGEVLNQLSAIVHIASVFAIALDMSKAQDAIVPKVSTAAWEQLNLNQDACLQIFTKIERQFAEICEILIA